MSSSITAAPCEMAAIRGDLIRLALGPLQQLIFVTHLDAERITRVQNEAREAQTQRDIR